MPETNLQTALYADDDAEAERQRLVQRHTDGQEQSQAQTQSQGPKSHAISHCFRS